MIDRIELINQIKNQPEIRDNEVISNKKTFSKKWFLLLRDIICNDFVKIKKNFVKKKYIERIKENYIPHFKKKKWIRDGGGGGTMSVMKGYLFEKVGVNVSTVFGKFSNNFKSQIPGAEITGKFWATGISVVAHMHNPKIPAVHMNTRFLVTGDGKNKKTWFGGGCDLTPMLKDKNAENFFHESIRKMCNKHNSKYYKEFKEWCDDYFFLPHRNEARGVGGIFFDYLNSMNWNNDFMFVKDVGKTFVETYNKIVKERMLLQYTHEEKLKQLEKRGRYVEFNLLYDRGTVFGLKTQGNTEAILMSLPPQVNWN